jgi:hypothetical protein
MDDCIRIGPGVLFSAVVLSPEWGREYQRTAAPSPHDPSVHAPSPVAGATARGSRDGDVRSSEQLMLL